MFAFMLISLFKPNLLVPLIDWIKLQIQSLWNWNYLLAFISALAESLPIVGTIIPGQVILMSVWGFYGWLWYAKFIGVLISAIIGSVISNAVGYFLGKKYWEDFFKKYGMWVWIEQTELKYLKKWVNTWWAWGIVLSKFHPHARAFLPFIAGSMGFTKTKFWIFNVIASTLWAIVFITIGIFFAEFYETIVQYFWKIMLAVIMLIITYLWFFKRDFLKAYWQEKNVEMQKKYEQKIK